MKLAVSNLAWNDAEEPAVIELLHRESVRGVEIAPTRWKPRPYEAPAAEVAGLRRHWNDAGLSVVSLQSLLFGRPDLQLFGAPAQREALGDYLERAIDFAAALGAGALVFGSPRNRTRGDLPAAEAMSIAVDFFARLAPHAAERNTVVCIEANPPGYQCDFITATSEAVALCRAVGSPGIGVNIDLGGMTMADEDPGLAIDEAGALVGHVHASEPELAPLTDADRHARAARALRVVGYRNWVSIEMRRVESGGEAGVGAVERAIHAAKRAYAPLFSA